MPAGWYGRLGPSPMSAEGGNVLLCPSCPGADKLCPFSWVMGRAAVTTWGHDAGSAPLPLPEDAPRCRHSAANSTSVLHPPSVTDARVSQGPILPG